MAQLIVFADDWGRHPSSAQHLVRRLLSRHPTLWVNTIGTRRVRLSGGDLRRITGKVAGWLRRPTRSPATQGPRVIAPFMWPGFRWRWQRWFNAQRMAEAVNEALSGPSTQRQPRIVVTTLPITADLVGRIRADRWVYYCVDDFSVWPGLDSDVMAAMERDLLAKVDAVLCVSETLRQRLSELGRAEATLLTHGVDLEHWSRPPADSRIPSRWPDESRHIALFWGLLDPRMDVRWCEQLVSQSALRLVLAGPTDQVRVEPHEAGGRRLHFMMGGLSEPDPILPLTDQVRWLGPVAMHDLPAVAACAQVLIMPYRDLPVTRAMQPLKLLEYLATMKPVVVRDLPATRAWADCCDVAATPEDFVRLCVERARTGLPAEQAQARRRRLPQETWDVKAAAFEAAILAGVAEPQDADAVPHV